MTSTIPTTSGFAWPAWEESLIGPPGLLAAFIWGLAEATFFFVIPGVLLSLVAILDWPRTWKHTLAAICGALLGGALLFHWAKADFAQAHSAVLRVPFVREAMVEKVRNGFRDQGLLSVLLGSISGLPYKPLRCGSAELYQRDQLSSDDSAGALVSLPSCLGRLWRGCLLAQEASPLAPFPVGQNPRRCLDCFLHILLGAHHPRLSASV